MANAPRHGRQEWTRRYPPLAAVVAAVLLAIFTLPSALNLPLANPGQTLEYAPVPGGNGQAPPGGNLAALGLAASGVAPGASGGASGGPAGGGVLLPGQSGQPTDKQCVGNPPRQTEDPLSPPCVAYFNGDNGGATYTGVTRNAITVVFRYVFSQAACWTNSAYQPCGPPKGYYDMDNPNDVAKWNEFRYLNDWERYFNKRFQTYGRTVHFIAYNNAGQTGQTYDASTAAADAADNWNNYHPFADFDESGLFSGDYTGYLAQHGVLSFGGLGFTEQLASNHPGLYWSFPPTLDRMAQEYASYVCQRIVKPGHVSFSGNNDTGATRSYGLLITDDPAATVDQERQQLAVKYLQQDCGIQFADTERYHYSGGNDSGPKSGWGSFNMAAMKAKGVTTIIWPGGAEVEDMKAASQQGWHPEWVIQGDDYMDGVSGGQGEPSDEMTHAWIVTREPLQNYHGMSVEAPCYDALLATDPSIDQTLSDVHYACTYYDDLRQLFTGIQVAGPKLTPATMDQGLHAIPAKPSDSPYEPSCYYLPGDYTCVKDAAAMWWDPNGPVGTGSTPGCWRMWEGGRRYLVGGWPPGDAEQGKDPNGDPCNLWDYGTNTYVRTD